jgi:hypothetical protein
MIRILTKALFLFPFLGMVYFVASAQVKKNKPGTGLEIVKAAAAIQLDGKLEEADWKNAAVATDFFLNYPVDSLPPTFQSEARMTFDEHFLYVSFVCYDDSKPDIVQSLRRDIDWDRNDNIGIYFDPFNDYTNGFYFTITPFGVQSEGTISGGGQDGDGSFNNSWDNKWYSHATRYHDRWIAELAIPLKSFRYSHTSKEWNVTFLRNDVKRNQVSSWIATPIQFIPASFAYSGKLHWETSAPHAGANISVIPYVATVASQNIQDNKPVGASMTAGGDAKVALSPSLNLDLTINPDFSNVEVDQQVINLTRFEFQFPERRPFFLENSDLFSTPGYPDTRPFFSRRIGLVTDNSGSAKQVPILYGARISGKIGKNWRVGLLNMRTEEKASLGLPDQMYSMAIVQRQIFSRSNIDFFIVDKQSLGLGSFQSGKFYQKDLIKKVGNDTVLNLYNRVFGVDFNLVTKSNKWFGDFYYHQSMDDFHADKNYSAGAFLGYRNRHLGVFFGNNVVAKNFVAETGYLPKMDVYPGYLSGFGRVEGTAYPKSKKIATISSGLETNYTFIPDSIRTDLNLSFDFSINFLNTSAISISAANIFQRLTENFSPLSPKVETQLLVGDPFHWNEFQIEYNSNTRKVFTYNLQASGGQFYSGQRQSYSGTVSYRYQPYGSISLTADYNSLQMGENFGNAEFLLIRPRLDFTLSTKLFLTTVLQSNSRYESMNLNTRLQWRFRPASDLFIVYSYVENKLPVKSPSSDQALVIKFTYWLNL